MPGTRAAATAAVLALLIGGCAPDGADEVVDDAAAGGDLLTPSFTPAPAGEAGTGTTVGGASTTTPSAPAEVAPGGGPGAVTAPVDGAPPEQAAAAPGPSPVAPAGTTRSSSATTDPGGDPTPAPALTARPAWADLAGAALAIDGDAVGLRVRLADDVPDVAPDADHTMNVATFYDLDGDGGPDVEVWANLGEGGWGPSRFDAEGAAYGDDAAVAIEVAGDELVLRFPVGHLGGATTLRWSVASEWGRYESIGTAVMARDDAPDDDAAVTHPS